MAKKLITILILLIFACDTGDLTVVTDLPRVLSEVSGIEKVNKFELFWMINDSGNSPILFGLDSLGTIKKQIKIKAKNHDWEDLASDKSGNLYIGDFGNNANKRKDLVILKVINDSLNFENIGVEQISFYFPEQKKFPPKVNDMHFDSEAFIYYNDSLFLFTKSRTKMSYGKTNLYKISAEKGNHKAEFISSFTTCSDVGCWITSVDINEEENKIAILTEHSVWIISDFNSSNFFSGTTTKYPFNHRSQKESVLFKNDSTLYITDERSNGRGGKLYSFNIK
ncbi:MAG: hypothetical protein DA407_00300 [Bacteroidetes bacterium]|nr:MAG: hypothetical protein DA407_00300 [Bacteroidota bacterium]